MDNAIRQYMWNIPYVGHSIQVNIIYCLGCHILVFATFGCKGTTFFRDMQIISVIFMIFVLFYTKSKLQDVYMSCIPLFSVLNYMFPHTKHIHILPI